MHPPASTSSRPSRSLALAAIILGAAGSVGLMLRVGHRNPSVLLTVLFTIWVLSPFAGFVVADSLSARWSAATRATLHGVMLLLTAASLAIYGRIAFGAPVLRPAFAFLVVPLGSWLLMAVAVTAAALAARREADS